jgi:hypothetical protein
MYIYIYIYIYKYVYKHLPHMYTHRQSRDKMGSSYTQSLRSSYSPSKNNFSPLDKKCFYPLRSQSSDRGSERGRDLFI